MPLAMGDVRKRLAATHAVESAHPPEDLGAIDWRDGHPEGCDLLLGMGRFRAIHGDDGEFIKRRVYDAVRSTGGRFEVEYLGHGVAMDGREDEFIAAIRVVS